MRNFSNFFALAFTGMLFMASCSSGQNYSNVKLNTKEDTVSYYLGISYGSSMKEAYVDSIFNYEAFAKGISDAFNTEGEVVSNYLIQTYLNMFFTEFQEEQIRNQYQDYIAENDLFLEENAQRDSVVTLPSGVQYVILTESDGAKPEPTDQVKVHYVGYLIDGTQFDSSYERGEPAVFGVDQVIEGWSEVVQLMTVGSKWRAYLPADLAYGANSPEGSLILPYSTLIFEIELMEINPQ